MNPALTLEAEPVSHFDWRSALKAQDDTPASIVDALDSYFKPFAAPKMRGEGKEAYAVCIECDKPMTGLMSAFLGGGFMWGLVHGEGFCSACKWPARAMHYVKDESGTEVFSVRNFVLQYHPDVIGLRTALSEAVQP